MIKSWFVAVFILLYFTLVGCGGGGGGGGNSPENSDTTYVDVVNGNDTAGDGTFEKPYRTITFAFQQSSTKNTVKVAPGTYDSSTGEQFPIVIPPGRKLIADSIDLAANSFVFISGSGEFTSDYVNGVNMVAVVFDDANEIRNLVIEASDGVALWVERATISSKIVRSGFYSSQVGLTFVNNASPEVNGNVVEQNIQNGVELLGSASPMFLKNEIKDNGVGMILADTVNPTFDDSSGSGGNSIINNTLCDFRHTGATDINAVGTVWDEDMFEFTISNSCSAGENIVIEGTGSVDYQFIPPINVQILPSPLEIRTDLPMFGELLFTQQPDFEWASTGAHITMVVVWKQPPIVDLIGITSTENIHWIWHSGLSTGGSGYAQFADGRSLQGTNISSTISPQPFEIGRSYYWAVWMWDAEGKDIYASSSLSYFRVSN